MAKYIDADRLNADLDKWVEAMADAEGDYSDGVRFAIQHFIFLLASLQQEQPESSKGKFVFPKFLYARTLDNKTMDISYAPQSMEAVEYVRNDFIEQEQQGADLEKEIADYWTATEWCQIITLSKFKVIARYFYGLGKNSK